jgi:hypothetical protein
MSAPTSQRQFPEAIPDGAVRKKIFEISCEHEERARTRRAMFEVKSDHPNILASGQNR